MRQLDPSDVIAFALFLVLPAILPFVRRAAPPILVVTGVFAAFVLWRQARLGKFCRAHLYNPATLLFVAFIAWAAISLAWSAMPSRGGVFIAAATILVASILTISEFPLSKRAPTFLLAGLSIGGAVIALDLLMGRHLLQLIHKGSVEAWRYNITIVSLCVFSLVLLRHLGSLKPYKIATALFFVYMATFLSESETAKLVLILFPIMFLLTSVMPLSAIKPAAFCLFAFIFLFAATGMPGLIFLKTLVPPDFWRHASGDERLFIWSGVADFAFHGLPFGWGVETLANPKATSYFVAASQETQLALSHWHPHNNFLQIMTELGSPGVVIAFALLGVVVAKRLPRSRMRAAAFLTFVTAIMGIAAISHGFWQSWWWALVLVAWYAMVGGVETREGQSI